MKKLTILAVLFALSASLLAGCRFGRGDSTTTTTKNPHTLPETTGATITMPTESTTHQTRPTMPSTNGTEPGFTDGTNGTNGTDSTDSTNETTGTQPDTRDRSRARTRSRY